MTCVEAAVSRAEGSVWLQDTNTSIAGKLCAADERVVVPTDFALRVVLRLGFVAFFFEVDRGVTIVEVDRTATTFDEGWRRDGGVLGD